MNDDLKGIIKYSDDTEETPVSELPADDEQSAEIETEEKTEEASEEVSDAAEDEQSEEEQPDSDKQFMSSRRKIIVFSAITAVLVILITVFSVVDTGFIGTFKKNVSANVQIVLRNIGIDTSSGSFNSSGPVTDLSAISEDDDGMQEQIKVKATPKPAEKEYKTKVDYSVIVPFNSAADSDFALYKKGIVCAKSNYLCYMNAEGEKEWELTTSVTDPILKAEGEYILIAQQDGKKLCMYKDDKLIYDKSIDNNILSCNVSSKGDAVIVMTKQFYRGAFSVYNKNGDEIYAWSSGSDLVLSADISDGARRVAASLVNTDGKVRSKIMLFNINKANSYSEARFSDTVLFDLKFSGEEINAFGDNAMVGMNTSGKVLYDKRFDEVELINYAMDSKGSKIMVFNSDNIPMMNVYNDSGSLKYTMTTRTQSDYVDINNYNVIYNDNRDILLGKPNSRNSSKYTASMDIKELILLDSRTFVIVYFNSLEFVKM